VHALFESGEIVRRERRLAVEVVVEAVLDRRAEGHLALDLLASTPPMAAMAARGADLWRRVQVTFGPSIENGFYYDFHRETPFTPDDLARLEKRMHEIVDRDEPITRDVWNRDQAVKYFESIGERFKAEHIATIPADEDISIYSQGKFTDLCTGPHLPSTGKLGHAFKLMKLAGSYWRGDAKNARLQRVYGTAWPSEDALKAHLHQLEEAEKRDHRRIGKEMGLFHLQEEAVGSVFWHPNGWALYRVLERHMRRRLEEAGYLEVKTPQLLDRALWERSGHWEKYASTCSSPRRGREDPRAEADELSGQVQIFRQGLKSYRDLPLRLAEFGSCHRYEPSGSIHGIMRVRAFTQDDGHIFCTEDQITDESVRFCAFLRSIYKDFGFEDVVIKFSDRPAVRAGSDEVWDKAEGSLRAAIEATGLPYTMNRAKAPSTGRSSIRAEGCHRPRLAVRHASGRLRAAGATRCELYRRGWPEASPGDGCIAPSWLVRALSRRADRALCRPVPAVAGAGAGGGRHGDPGGRCYAADVLAELRRPGSRRNRPPERENQLQGPRALAGQGPSSAGRGQERGRGSHRGTPPIGRKCAEPLRSQTWSIDLKKWRPPRRPDGADVVQLT